MASQVWGGAGGPPAYAVVRLNRDGTALVQTGTQDLGTGARTIFAQIAAEALGLPLKDVRMAIGDTDGGPYTNNSWGSMTTPSVGPAVRMAAEDAKRQLFEVAAEMLHAKPEQLEARRGRISVSGGASVTIRKVTEQLGDIMIMGRGHRGPNPSGVTVHSFGAQAAEVEVDRLTGRVRVIRIVAAHDCGRVINPELAESQLHGGIILGLGYALFERRESDAKLGRPLNLGLHEYKIPTHADIPDIDARIISVADPVANHVGAKGLAEPPIIPTAPAIANAVFDALGIQVTELPLTPGRVLEAIKTHS
jgi:xanthine dehydrogenase YagR molybdenum-binding subunit